MPRKSSRRYAGATILTAPAPFRPATKHARAMQAKMMPYCRTALYCALLPTLMGLSIFLIRDGLLQEILSADTHKVAQANANCLDAIDATHDLDHGICDFSSALLLPRSSPGGARTNPVAYERNFLPCLWTAGREDFLPGGPNGDNPTYNFAIVPKPNFKARLDRLLDTFGPATDSFYCSQDSSIDRVLLYDEYSPFAARLKNAWRNDPESIFFRPELGRWVYAASGLPIHEEVRRRVVIRQDTLTTIPGATPAGMLTYGPYARDLPPGPYKVSLRHGIARVSPGAPALRWDLLLNGEEILASGAIPCHGDGPQTFKQAFSLDKVGNFLEFRTFLDNSMAEVTLFSLELIALAGHHAH